MKKEYSNKELTVVWKPEKCSHAGECVKRLPEVYKPKEKPWINLENASSEALIRQINNCPSGALSYYLNEESLGEKKEVRKELNVTILENGPLLVKGKFKVTGISGKVEEKENSTAFCRCGASANKPYCDGKHKGIGFRG